MKPIMLVVAAICLGTAGDDQTIELKEIGVSLPAAVESIKYQRRQNFDQNALGYSVAYGNSKCAITLIVYDHDKTDIPDGKANPLVEDQMRRSIEDLKTAAERGAYKNLQPMKGKLPLPKPVLETFASAGFHFEAKGGQCKSFILLAGRQKHFLKVRLTQFAVDEKTNDEEVNAFLTVLAKAVAAKKGTP